MVLNKNFTPLYTINLPSNKGVPRRQPHRRQA